MFNKSKLKDIKLLWLIIYSNRYKVSLFVLLIFIGSNLYVYKLQSSYEIEKVIFFKNQELNKLINHTNIFENIRSFYDVSGRNDDLNFTYRRYSNSQYSIRFSFIGNNKDTLKLKMDNFMETFYHDITEMNHDLLVNLNQEKKHSMIRKEKYEHTINLYYNKIEEVDKLFLKLMPQKLSHDTISKFNSLLILRNELNNLIEKNKLSEKESLKYDIFSKFKEKKIEVRDLLQVKENIIKQYKPSKLKFIVMSFIFSVIMSLIMVVLFFNKNKK